MRFDFDVKPSKKAIENLEYELWRAQERLQEAEDEVDYYESEIAKMRTVLDGEATGEFEIVAVNVTPAMTELAKRGRGKSWGELRTINDEYERMAAENAVYAPIAQEVA